MSKPLTKLEKQRIEVIKDALLWITPKKVKSGYGYVRNPSLGSTEALSGANSKTTAKKLQKTCYVCAQGALLLSVVALHNKFDFAKANNYDSVHLTHDPILDRLKKLWTIPQLNIIEQAFEASDPCKDDGICSDFHTTAQVFGWKYSKDITRMRAIFKNMLENRGTFKPELVAKSIQHFYMED